jgi:hypothetical protein
VKQLKFRQIFKETFFRKIFIKDNKTTFNEIESFLHRQKGGREGEREKI